MTWAVEELTGGHELADIERELGGPARGRQGRPGRLTGRPVGAVENPPLEGWQRVDG